MGSFQFCEVKDPSDEDLNPVISFATTTLVGNGCAVGIK